MRFELINFFYKGGTPRKDSIIDEQRPINISGLKKLKIGIFGSHENKTYDKNLSK